MTDKGVEEGLAECSVTEKRDLSVETLQAKAKTLSGDYEEQIRNESTMINDLKRQIVIQSKEVYILEQRARELDSKIHLLIKNRMAIEDISVDTDEKDGKKGTQQQMYLQTHKKVYENLFHYLQTHPQHLALLTRCATLGEVSQLLQTIIFTLYADQFDAREEHLLLRLFQIVLQAEFDACDEMATFMRGNTGATQMLCAYTRRGPGHATLKKTLTPSLTALSKIPNLNLEINPLKVYQAMINELETQSGTNCDLPRNVTMEEAAAHKRVQQTITARVAQLHALATDIFNRIISCMDEMPYGLRWIGKQLRMMAKIKFPDASKYKIGSLVGGFIYLRFFNPAIVSPDSLNLIEQKPSPIMRRNLILIAKLLQNLSNGVEFGGKEQFMAPLNRFIVQNRDKLQAYFEKLTDVADLDHHLQVDQYLESFRSEEKIINITFNEFALVHMLTKKYLDEICPEKDSLLREMLGQLGPAPEKLERKSDFSTNLKLVPHPKLKATENQEMKSYAEAKALLVSVLRALPNLPEGQSSKLMDALEAGKSMTSDPALLKQLDEVVEQLHKVSSLDSTKYNPDNPDPYMGVVVDLHEYVEQRQRQKSSLKVELETLRNVLDNIKGNGDLVNGKVMAYEGYLKEIKKHDFASKKDDKKKKKKDKGSPKREEENRSFVISHQELERSGVIFQSKVPADVRKHVKFTFTSDKHGTIDVVAVYRGINVVRFQLEFEELLERQHDGEEHLIFEEVTLTINFLIHLINERLIVGGGD